MMQRRVRRTEDAMDAPGTYQRHGWRFGLHPEASGSVIRAMTRVTLPVGDALRIEMEGAQATDPIHVQYHVATGSGGWALWISCAAEEVGEVEAALPELVVPEETDEPA
jgi:hypothetical protein